VSHSKGTFATALDCMDGRTKDSVIEYARKKFNVDNVDMITEPGIDGLFGGEDVNSDEIERLAKKIGISVNGHGSRNIVVAGHDSCAGNPVDNQTHVQQTLKAAELVRGLDVVKENGVNVVPIFLAQTNSHWTIEEI
jgi:hypothetical protein